MALGSCSTAASCSRLVDENGPASSTGGRGQASTWQLQLSHWAVRASTDEQRTGYALGVAIVHPPSKMPRCDRTLIALPRWYGFNTPGGTLGGNLVQLWSNCSLHSLVTARGGAKRKSAKLSNRLHVSATLQYIAKAVYAINTAGIA